MLEVPSEEAKRQAEEIDCNKWKEKKEEKNKKKRDLKSDFVKAGQDCFYSTKVTK